MMHICGGLVGPKTENVEKPLVLPLLFEGSRERKAFQECQGESEKVRCLVEKIIKRSKKETNEPLDMRW